MIVFIFIGIKYLPIHIGDLKRIYLNIDTLWSSMCINHHNLFNYDETVNQLTDCNLPFDCLRRKYISGSYSHKNPIII